LNNKDKIEMHTLEINHKAKYAFFISLILRIWVAIIYPKRWKQMQTVRTKIFEYGQREIDYLKSVDHLLGEAIDRMGKIDRVIIPELFPALIYAIIGQQISLKAARTLWARMQERFIDITPEHIATLPLEDIQQCGMQSKKAGYIKGIAEVVAKGELDLNILYAMPDDEVIKRLSSLSGIGVWTAEMLLLNSMERPNIISYGDIAIRRGIMNLYGLTELTKEQFAVYKNRYSPYASVASIYLWRISYE
jgi:DNA-3-methyladenine glycosylase II